LTLNQDDSEKKGESAIQKLLKGKTNIAQILDFSSLFQQHCLPFLGSVQRWILAA